MTAVTLTGGFIVAAPPRRVFHYFTPLGEKEWAAGWEPEFLSDNVFETRHGHGTTWVVVDSVPGERIRYARVAHGITAGTVEVTLVAQGDASDASAVTVTYELAALSDKGREHLESFARGYDAYLRSWQEAITSILH